MSFWDFKRGPARIRLLVDYARAKGYSLVELLKGSGLALTQLDDPNAELLAAQELRVISNLLKLTGAPDQLGIDLGLRYHFSAYGVWGFGLISSATMRDALTLALSPLSHSVPAALAAAFNGLARRGSCSPSSSNDGRPGSMTARNGWLTR